MALEKTRNRMKTFKEFKDELPIEENQHQPDQKIWETWKKLVNMTAKELKSFYDSDEGKDAGMKQGEADKAGIDSGRESARMLFKMIPNGSTFKKAEENWTPNMWITAKRVIIYINRLLILRKNMINNPFERNGKKTMWYKKLLIHGHDPKKR